MLDLGVDQPREVVVVVVIFIVAIIGTSSECPVGKHKWLIDTIGIGVGIGNDDVDDNDNDSRKQEPVDSSERDIERYHERY